MSPTGIGVPQREHDSAVSALTVLQCGQFIAEAARTAQSYLSRCVIIRNPSSARNIKCNRSSRLEGV